MEIEEKINKIKWCKRQNSAHFLLSTNGKLSKFNNCNIFTNILLLLLLLLDKTIKLWKVFDKSLKLVTENSIAPNNTPVNTLRLPKLTHHDTIVAAVPRKVYANGTLSLI